MVISSFISSLLILALGIWAYMKLESSMNIVAEKQLLIEPSKFSYKMWKDMPVSMYQSFTFFNLTNWNQVKSLGQKPRFVEVGPYVYKTIWSKSDINFMEEEKLVSFAEKKQWIFQPQLSKGFEDDQIWTINTPLMTALALIQNAPVITRNIVSVILDGLGEGAFIKRNIRSLLFEGYSDLIVSVGPLFDRRFANFNGKFAYLYNKNDSVDGLWTVSTGTDDMSTLNKIVRFQSNIVNMTGQASISSPPQGLNEVKPECAPAWSLDQSTNGQLFSPFNQDIEQLKLQHQLQQIKSSSKTARSDVAAGRAQSAAGSPTMSESSSAPAPSKRFFSRSLTRDHQQDIIPNPFMSQRLLQEQSRNQALSAAVAAAQSAPSATSERPLQARDLGKFIFYPDLCRPIHLLPSKHEMSTANGIKVNRYYIDPRVFMNSTQIPGNRCYEMNPRPPLTNALAATINSVTGANVPNLVTGASSPFAMFSPPSMGSHHGDGSSGRSHERSNHPASFLNNALQSLSNVANQDQLAGSSSNNAPVSRLGRVRQLFSNIVSQRMSATGPGSLLPSLAAGPAGLLMGNHFPHSNNARNSMDDPQLTTANLLARQNAQMLPVEARQAGSGMEGLAQGSNPLPVQTSPAGGSDRWITQFRFKWPRGVFSIGQCQLGAPIYASLPHFLDADEYYLEQVDGLKPNRSLHEFYIDIESTLHSIPVGAKARLQLNVATPELRFRNIPNAMIPVLWQEVTFEIDKPVATMLYWSFTMSATIYKLISVLLLLFGSASLLLSFTGCYREHRRRKNKEVDPPPRGPMSTNSASVLATPNGAQLEGQRSSWQPHMISRQGMQRSNNLGRHLSARSPSDSTTTTSNEEALDEIRHGAALNHAFSSCVEFHDRLSDNNGINQQGVLVSGPSSTSTFNETSPKQPSSRASSHCELVSSLGNTVNCAGCLLACLRHSPNNGSHHHDHHQALASASDTSLVRKHCLNADKATLSSRESNLDSSSSIYTQRNRTFK